VSDEATARKTILNALKAFMTWHKKQESAGTLHRDDPAVQKIYTAIRRLEKESPNTVLRKEAEQVAESLKL
jgi:hypothetical protein